MCTCPVVIMVSTATRLRGSCASMASRIESLIWSAILSGWPSVTDSEVKRRRDTRYSLQSAAARGRRVRLVGVRLVGVRLVGVRLVGVRLVGVRLVGGPAG